MLTNASSLVPTKFDAYGIDYDRKRDFPQDHGQAGPGTRRTGPAPGSKTRIVEELDRHL